MAKTPPSYFHNIVFFESLVLNVEYVRMAWLKETADSGPQSREVGACDNVQHWEIGVFHSKYPL